MSHKCMSKMAVKTSRLDRVSGAAGITSIAASLANSQRHQRDDMWADRQGF